VKSTKQSQNQSQMFTPTKMRHLPMRQVVSASVGAYGNAISRELASPKSNPVHVENLCTTYNAHMRLLHSIISFENKLKAENLEDID
jgi:hypothetical protein